LSVHFYNGAAVTLILNYLLIPKISYYGSAIATIAAYGSMMIISYKMGQKYPIPYDINKIMTYLGVTILFSAISFYIPYVRESYTIRFYYLEYFYISSIITKRNGT
jgi:O-antigen/teichoic acid export membrane protein